MGGDPLQTDLGNPSGDLGVGGRSSLPGEHDNENPKGKKFWDKDRKLAKDFARVFKLQEGELSIGTKYRRYQKWYEYEKLKDEMTVIAYREASMECINNNLSDHKLTCKKVLEDYLACLHVHKAKYNTIM